ncbi:AAA ATPase midasin, partial [Spiromyces aspiralis]
MTDATYALQLVQSQPVPLLSVDTGIGGPSSQWLRIEVFADDGDAACTPAVCDLMSAGQAILTPLVWGYWNTLTDAPIYAHKALTLHTDQFLRSCLNAIDLAPRTSGSGDEAWQGIVETVSHLLCYVSALVESFATAEIGRELQSDGVGDWMGRTMSEFARIVANVTSAWLSPGSDDALCGIGEDLLRWWQPLETGGGLGRELLVRCHDLISGASASSDSFGVQTWLLARAIKLFDSVIPASTHRSALPCTDSLDDAEFSLLTAQAATTVSLLMLVASIPASPIDPSTKIAAYWDWLNSRKSALKADLVSHRLIERYRAGNFSDETSSTRKKITEAIDETDRQMAKAQLQIVYRPLLSDAATTTNAGVNDAYSFRSLWQEARRLIETGGPLDPRRLEEIFSAMRSLHDSAGSCGKGPALVEKRSQTLQSHLVQVERRLRVHYFDGFRDVAQVWLVWISRIREGLRRCAFAARRRCVFDSDITRRVYSTVSCWLPSYPLALAVARGTDGSADHNNSSSSNEWRELTDPRTLVAIKHALLSGRDARAAGASRGMSLYSRLLVLLLDHTRYLAAVTGYLDCDVLASMEGILAEVHNVWQWAESERKKKEAEANSLYKIREHENEDLDDAKIAERELNALFPSFDDDFQLTTGDAVDELNDVYPGKVQGERESQDSAATGRTVSGFDDGALRRLVELHGAILARFSTNSCQPLGLDSDSDSDHHDQKPQPQPQLTETGIATHSWRAQQILALTKQSQKIASLIFRSINKQSWSTPSAGTDNLTYDVPVGSPVDSRLGVSHAVALAIQHLESTQQPTLHGDTAPPGQLSEVDATSKKARVRASERPYNFYRDPNVVEAAKVPDALGPLNSRISQLLAAWPDHPVLLQIRELIDRILSFPAATSSVAKLLTGFEMLFQKASLDWQAYASRDVSIKDELARVSSQIIHWRQLELNTWPHLLRAQEVEAEQSVDKWWFHLYSSLVAPFPSAGGEVTEVGDGGQQALAPESAVRLVDQFLQMCPVGEFAVRLGMLSSFHSHLLIRESVHPDIAQQQLAFTLDNCIRHYTQFLPVLAAHLSQHRAPIARDLAEFVKISTWRDVNPAALRESAQKTHRHLSKHIRRWKAVLSQPVNQIIEADIVQYISVAAESDRWTADPHSICGSDSQDKRKKKRRQRKGKGKSNGMPRDSQRDGSNGGGFRSVSLVIYDVAATAATVPDRIAQQANCWASDRSGAESTLREFDKVFEVIQRRCQQEPELGQPISWQLYRVISDNGPTESDGGPHAGIRQYTDRLVQLGIDVMQIINRFQTMQLPSEIANKADLMLVAKHKEGDCNGSNNDAKAKVAAKPKKGKRVVTLKGLPNDDENGGSDNHKEITEEEAREAQKVAVRNFWAHQRQIKQKTITDLLKELKRLGLNPRFSPRNTLALSKSDPALSADKHSKAESDKDIGHLLLPTLAIHDWIQVTRHLAPVDAPTGFFHDGIGEATRLYRMSDRAFYEAHLLYQRLRAEAISPSPASPVDLTPDQIERVVGTMSHALHLLTEERKSGVEAMSQALRWMKLALMWQDSRYNDNDDGNASEPADRQPADSELGGAARLVAVKRLVDHAEELLTEIAVSVNTTCRAVDPSNVNGEKRRWLDQHLFPVVETLRALKKRISGVVARMVLAPRSALAGGLAGKGGTASTLDLVLTGRNFPVISSIHADFVQAMARVGKLVADTRGLSADRDSQMMAPWVGDTLMAFVNQALALAGTRHSP